MTQAISQVLPLPFLLATDGSPSAWLAQRLLYPIAQAAQQETSETATITILIVQPRRSSRSQRQLRARRATPPPTEAIAPSELSPAQTVEVVTQATELAESPEQLATRIQADFPTHLVTALQIRRGKPATEILNCARLLQTGLIAVGHRGSGGVRERLLGSVSSVIARYAPCSVLIARNSASTDQNEPHLNHVLLVVDGSPASRSAIAAAQQLLAAGIRQLTVLCVQPPLNANYLFGPFVTPTPSWQLNQSLQAAQKEQGEQILQQASKQFNPSELKIQTLLQIGEPGPLICQTAHQHQADLVLLGSGSARRSLLAPLQSLRRHRSQSSQRPAPLRNTRLSATEDYTIHHAPCPVLLCRTAINNHQTP